MSMVIVNVLALTSVIVIKFVSEDVVNVDIVTYYRSVVPDGQVFRCSQVVGQSNTPYGQVV